MCKRYFKFVKLKPGRVVTTLYSEIIKALYESDFPYLAITEDGKVELYGLDNIMKKRITRRRSKLVNSRALTI